MELELLKYPTSQAYTHKLVTYIQRATYKTYIDFTLLLPVHVSLKAADLLPPGCYKKLTNCRRKDSDILKAKCFYETLEPYVVHRKTEFIAPGRVF